MAAKWNWRKLGIGSGAVVAALSTVFALNPKGNEKNNAVDINDVIVHTDGRDGKNNIRFGKFLMAAPGTTPERKLEDAIKESRKICKRIKNELGLPGLTVAVSVNGKLMWQEGFGYSNLENGVKMKAESVMRIASISKSMTMAMMAKLMEEGKVNIDLPIQTYLPTFPEKFVDGEKVTITTRHLLSHLSGIRHYVKKDSEGKGNENDPEDMNVDKTSKKVQDKAKPQKKKKEVDEMDLQEYFLKDKFATVEDSMKLFKDDELFHKPGSKFYYTTHGWTVVSAIIEKLTETDFTRYSTRMFDFWGLKNTFLDFHEPLIHNRASYYTRVKNGHIINAPYVDNSYKWAGGGFLSTVADLNQFGNILLYSMQSNESSETCEKGLPKRPFLKQSTMKTMWTGNPATARPEVPDLLYALGFRVGEPLRKCVFCKERDLMTVSHGGAAVGASSYLLLAFPPLPTTNKNCDNSQKTSDVQGVVVSMITNLTSIGLSKSAEEIAENFRGLI